MIKAANLFSLTWSIDPETKEPLLCVAGPDAKIKILNGATGKLVKVIYDMNQDCRYKSQD